MPADLVLDASVAAKCLFQEPGSAQARAIVASAENVMAPDFLFTELASIASKKVRRGEATQTYGAEALARVGGLLSVVAASRSFVPRAYELATTHGFSVYDALYLSLAEDKGIRMVTADARLAARAQASGLGALIETLAY